MMLQDLSVSISTNVFGEFELQGQSREKSVRNLM
jgi:hypothetical protein